MPRVSAGLLMYRRRPTGIEVLLVHPGGPYFTNKDDGHWSIPKGEIEPGEPLVEVARREFEEEVGHAPGDGPLIELSPITQKRGKIVHAWAIEGDCDPATGRSNSFTMEWPAGSGRMAEFPEVDRAEFFPLDVARRKIKDRQAPLLDELAERLGEVS